MSATVRLWTDQELESAKMGYDRWLSTLLMNKGTFDQREMGFYPYGLRTAYTASFWGIREPVNFYATDDEMAVKFLKTEYTKPPRYLAEVLTNHRQFTVKRGTWKQ